MAISTAVSPDQIVFEQLHKYIAMQMSDLDLSGAKDLRIHTQYSLERLGTQITADWKDIAHRLADDKYTVYFYAPRNAWQMFKRDHAPEWFRRRYPVKEQGFKRTVKFTRYATYPRANLKVQRKGKITIPFLGGVERLEDQVRHTPQVSTNPEKDIA